MSGMLVNSAFSRVPTEAFGVLCTGIKSESEGPGLQPPGEPHSACLLMELCFHR